MIITEYKLLIVFPIFLLVTAPIRFAKDTFISPIPPKTSIVSSHGILNTVFAGSSFEVFLILYLTITLFKIAIWRKFTPVLPTTIQVRSSKRNVIIKETIKLFIIYASLIVLIVWAFGPSLFDRVNRWTGGYCNVAREIYYRSCVAHGGLYVNGFKSSGHSLIAATFGTAASYELLGMNDYCKNVNLTNNHKYLHKFVNVFVSFVYIAWVTLFLITCLFYHTFLERLVGTSLAIFIVYVVYYKM